MTLSRSLRQLLRIRSLEEDQSRTRLERAISELRQIEEALGLNQSRERRGRELVAMSHRLTGEEREGQGIDRRAGYEESLAALRRIHALTPRVSAQQQLVEELRAEFLARRVERRQAETLITEAAAESARERSRRAQQGLDDWFGARRGREIAEAEANRILNRALR